MLTSKQLALSAAAIFAAASANASVLLYEPFDYTTGNIGTKGGAETGFDGGSTWTENSTKTTNIQTASLGFGTLATTGNEFFYDSVGTESLKFAARPMNVSAPTGDLFMAFLMQGTGGNRLNGGAFVNGSATQEFGALRTEYDPGTGNALPNAPHVFYNGQSAVPAPIANPVATTTYMYVQKYTGLGSGSGGTAQLWLLDSSHYDTVAADGSVTIAELDANSLLSTTTITLAGAAPTLDGTETLRIHAHDSGSGRATYVLDEIRIATTLGEAMAIIPEPSSAALLSLGALALLRRRRK